MNKSFLLIVTIFISLFFLGCESKKNDNIVENTTPSTIEDPTFTVDNSVKPTEEITPPTTEISPPPNVETPKVETSKQEEKKTSYDFIKVTYTENNAEINFPEITGLNDKTKEDTINSLIKTQILNEFDKYTSSDYINFKVNYKITLYSNSLLSIYYYTLLSAPDLPYQHPMIYTTNIDMNTGKKVRLPDLVSVNDNLLQFIDERHLKEAAVPRSESLRKSGMSYINEEKTLVNKPENYSYNLLYRLTAADDTLGILSYLTEDSVVICSYFPHQSAYPLEFEIKFEEIKNNIKSENALWKSLLK
ncbi:hypothetical protein [Clostridium cellulovorans]|uniref:Lipoprotein n=1 Tax=Clostridium cellulovorans (strain ATCC 35296 / DSM 3052 / OCM 3 / 743B) TaxID=573061 RepID=D9SRM0_CLOC7|nr:hypothetical protein [Clostridium cellulovorans]ADL50387.1 hypothetical protein Clocel_0616 [Clostridium cellulovorans 743B]